MVDRVRTKHESEDHKMKIGVITQPYYLHEAHLRIALLRDREKRACRWVEFYFCSSTSGLYWRTIRLFTGLKQKPYVQLDITEETQGTKTKRHSRVYVLKHGLNKTEAWNDLTRCIKVVVRGILAADSQSILWPFRGHVRDLNDEFISGISSLPLYPQDQP